MKLRILIITVSKQDIQSLLLAPLLSLHCRNKCSHNQGILLQQSATPDFNT